ncbi:hypothetical protein B0T20DRAFT_488053 [Sordaria brevicollis]|uniref:Uncharacterized protein n=1 Tax=Sordaria brevicollis TaxID=83679 RepID=A0AAE0P2U9_SORBR|nr:hypothetical protein B0T20DRAFT_488053 [Sordaria brevicollis]
MKLSWQQPSGLAWKSVQSVAVILRRGNGKGNQNGSGGDGIGSESESEGSVPGSKCVCLIQPNLMSVRVVRILKFAVGFAPDCAQVAVFRLGCDNSPGSKKAGCGGTGHGLQTLSAAACCLLLMLAPNGTRPENLLIGADMHHFRTRQLDANAMPTDEKGGHLEIPVNNLSIDAAPIVHHQSFSGSCSLGAIVIIIIIVNVIVADSIW